MTRIVVFDSEYLTKKGAIGRMWSGFDDPDPIVVQIGAVLLDIDKGAEIIDDIQIYIKPQDRHGTAYLLDPYFTDLTGISDSAITKAGVDLATGLGHLDRFSGSADLWSWGKDEFFTLAVSCFVRGIAVPMAVTRFANLKRVLRRAGMPDADINATNSGGLAEYFGVGDSTLFKHDALDDARSLALSLHHLMAQGRLSKRDFGRAE